MLIDKSKYDELDDETKELIEEGAIAPPTICPFDEDFCWCNNECFDVRNGEVVGVCSRYRGDLLVE